MQRISTNLTLFYKIFIPVFWVVFFGTAVISFFVEGAKQYGGIDGMSFRLGLLAFFISGLIILYFSFWQLKRVEMGPEGVYCTDYFKHVRYSWDSIKGIRTQKLLFFTMFSIDLHQKGKFGKTIHFFGKEKTWNAFLDQHPSLFEEIDL